MKNEYEVVFEQEFLGDGPQKKLASTFASNDWVFSLDADERLEDDFGRI